MSRSLDCLRLLRVKYLPAIPSVKTATPSSCFASGWSASRSRLPTLQDKPSVQRYWLHPGSNAAESPDDPAEDPANAPSLEEAGQKELLSNLPIGLSKGSLPDLQGFANQVRRQSPARCHEDRRTRCPGVRQSRPPKPPPSAVQRYQKVQHEHHLWREELRYPCRQCCPEKLRWLRKEKDRNPSLPRAHPELGQHGATTAIKLSAGSMSQGLVLTSSSRLSCRLLHRSQIR